MKIKRNAAVVSVIVLLLCVAVYLNWSYSRTNGDTDGDLAAVSSDEDRFDESQWQITSSDTDDQSSGDILESDYPVVDARVEEYSDYFDQTRLDRQTARDSELSELKATLASADTSDDAKTVAESDIADIASRSVTESRIESLVLAKGFLECVAVINDDDISVVVLPEEAGLQASDVAKIKDIILSETDFEADAIRVIETQ